MGGRDDEDGVVEMMEGVMELRMTDKDMDEDGDGNGRRE